MNPRGSRWSPTGRWTSRPCATPSTRRGTPLLPSADPPPRRDRAARGAVERPHAGPSGRDADLSPCGSAKNPYRALVTPAVRWPLRCRRTGSIADRTALNVETHTDAEDHPHLGHHSHRPGRPAVPGHPLLSRRGRTADPGDAVHLRLQPGGLGGDVRGPVLGLPHPLGPAATGGVGGRSRCGPGGGPMNTPEIIGLGAIALFLVVPLIIGTWSATRSTGTASDYFVQGRSMGSVAVFFTVTATWWSAFAFLGSNASFYLDGPLYWTALVWNIFLDRKS